MNNWLYYLLPVVFIIIVLYVYRPWAKKRYDKDAEIPFADDQDKPAGEDSSKPD